MNICTPVVIAAQCTVAKIWKQPKCPSVDEWVKTLVCLHNGTLCSSKKNEFLPLVTAWMDLESIVLNETSQSVTDKYHMISLIHGI